jgi:hypothetical protein
MAAPDRPSIPVGCRLIRFRVNVRAAPPERLCLTAGNLTHFVAGTGQTQGFSYTQFRNCEGVG